MPTTRYLSLATLLLLAGTLSCSAADPQSGAAGPVSPDVITFLADFRTKVPNLFVTGSWQNRIGVSPQGLVVEGAKGADGKGEFGLNLDPPLDLSKEEYVEVAFGVGARNAVPALTIAFSDAAGVQYTASIRIDQVLPQQATWLRARLSDFQLNNWDGTKTGKVIDWTRVTQWHLQGDWKTTAPFHVMFIALRTRR